MGLQLSLDKLLEADCEVSSSLVPFLGVFGSHGGASDPLTARMKEKPRRVALFCVSIREMTRSEARLLGNSAIY